MSEGWTNLEDLRGNVLLQRVGDLRDEPITTRSFVGIYRDVSAPDACMERQDTGIDKTVEDLTSWFQSNEQLTVSKPQAVEIGGLEGV